MADIGITKANFLFLIKAPAKRAVAAIGEKFGISEKYIFKNAKQKIIAVSTINLTLFKLFI